MEKLIQWYPGHMAKTMRLIRENLSNIDIVFFVLDSRIPQTSLNPMLLELVDQKPILFILNRSDLANPKITERYINNFQTDRCSAISVDARELKLNKLEPKINQIISMTKKSDHDLRALISGVPNVGKSTVLNHMVSRNVVKTENRPGVTQKVTWQPTKKGFQLMDTPGLLWPKFEDQISAKKLALTGAIKDTHFYADDIAIFLIEFLHDNHLEKVLLERYNLDELADTSSEIIMQISNKLAYKDDYDKASWRLINDFRQGKLGRISLDLI